MHEARPFPICAGAERQSGYHRTGIEQNIRRDRSEPMKLLAETTGLFNEYGDVVVGVRPLVAARPRAVQHDPLEAIPVDLIEGGPKAAQDRVGLWVHSVFHRLARTPARRPANVVRQAVPVQGGGRSALWGAWRGTTENRGRAADRTDGNDVGRSTPFILPDKRWLIQRRLSHLAAPALSCRGSPISGVTPVPSSKV